MANQEKQSKLRLVTALTLARLPLVLFFLVIAIINVFHPNKWLFISAFVFMVSSSLTDLFDGKLARKYGVETDFGAHADPLMDKMFYVITLPVLIFITAIEDPQPNVFHTTLLLIITIMFLARDLWVTFLRSIGSMYNVSGCANWTGKVRTALNFPLICAIYLTISAPLSWRFIPIKLLYGFEIFALLVNFYSVVVYTKYYWPQLLESAKIKER